MKAAKHQKLVLGPPEPSLGDRLNARAYGQKVAQTFSDRLRPRLSELEAKASDLEYLKEAASRARLAQVHQAECLAPVLDALRGLDQTDQDQVLQLVSWVREMLKAQRRERQSQRGRSKGYGWSL